MASVKTGVGRARARTSDAMGVVRGESPGMGVSSRRDAETLWRRAFTLIFATTEWSQKGAMASVKTGAGRIVVIPNGVDVEEYSRIDVKAQRTKEPLNPETRAKRDGTFEPSLPHTVLYVGRLHPLKGLELLVEAWGLLRPPSGRNGECKNGGGKGEGARLECDRELARGEPVDVPGGPRSGRNGECKNGRGKGEGARGIL